MFKRRIANDDPVEIAVSKRSDKRYNNLFWVSYNQMKDLKPKLRFVPDSIGNFEDWQNQVRSRLRELIAFPEDYIQPDYKCLWCKKRNGYELQKWEAYPEPYALSYFYLLVPDNISEKVPAVLCAPGGNGSKELLAGEPELDGNPTINRYPARNRQAYHYVKAGYVAVAVSGGSSGENNDDELPSPESKDAFWNDLWMGRAGERNAVLYKYQILQWLKKCSFVDSSRIAVSAHSMSTTHVMMAALLDPEISAVVYNDYICNWHKRQIATTLPSLNTMHLLAGMIRYFDYVDLIAAMAPRPFLVTEGGRTEELELIKKAYQQTNAEDNFEFHYHSKYSSEGKRKYDNIPLCESMNTAEFLEYANVDASNHYFKRELAIPWLNKIFKYNQNLQ